MVVLMAGIYCSESRQRERAEDVHRETRPASRSILPGHAGHAVSPASDYRTPVEHCPQEAVGTSTWDFYGELVPYTPSP